MGSEEKAGCLGFWAMAGLNGLFQFRIGSPLPQQETQVGFLIGKDANPEPALSCHPETVAGRAEMIADGADQADFPFCSGISHPPGRSVQTRAIDGMKRPQAFKTLLNLFRRKEPFFFPVIFRPYGHVFNKTDMKRFFPRKPAERKYFIIIDAPHSHDINFNRFESDFFGPFNALPDPVEIINPG